MKRGITLIVLTIFLTSFVLAFNPTGSAVNEDSDSEQNSVVTIQNLEQTAMMQANAATDVKIQNAVTVRNRLRVQAETGECPEGCECKGSTTKCQLENGREMTIRAGNSGNTIVQVKGENMTTKVVLYHHNGKVYGVFKNNKTRTVNVLPDQVREKLRERMRARMEVRNITLDDDGVYQVEAKKNGKLFFIFPVRERVETQINSETGEITRTRTSWWGFLARAVRERNETNSAQ